MDLTRYFRTEPNNLTQVQKKAVEYMWDNGFTEGVIADHLHLNYYDVRDFIIVKYNREKGIDEQDS